MTYLTLTNNNPLHIENVGTFKPPTVGTVRRLSENFFWAMLGYAGMSVRDFYTNFLPDKLDLYLNLSKEEKESINLFDLVIGQMDDELIRKYITLYEIFFLEEVIYNRESKTFILFDGMNDDGQYHIVGEINRDNFDYINSLLLEFSNAKPQVEEESFYDSNAVLKESAKELMKLIGEIKKKKNGKPKPKKKIDPMYELGNVVSVVCAFGENGISCLNIDDVSIFNLYDQFSRIVYDRQYYLSARSVSIWGDKENKFESTSYARNLQKEEK